MHNIKKADAVHADSIMRLAHLLWPEVNVTVLKNDIHNYYRDSTCALFVYEVNDQVVGFAHVQLRFDYVEGTQSTPVGYLEGIYVQEDYRKKGIGRELVEVCEDWARFMNATEFASDVALVNEASAHFHAAIGMKEVNRIVCYVKRL